MLYIRLFAHRPMTFQPTKTQHAPPAAVCFPAARVSLSSSILRCAIAANAAGSVTACYKFRRRAIVTLAALNSHPVL